MGAIANISLKNAAAAEQVFTANQPENGVVWFYHRTASNALGHMRVSMSLKAPRNGGPNAADTGRQYKAQFNLYKPTLENPGTTDGGYTAVPKRAYENVAQIVFLLPERGAVLECQDLRAMVVDLFTEANVIDMIDNFNGTY